MSDLVCREKKGGCGKRLVIIEEPYRMTWSVTMRKEGTRKVAVHEDEVGDRTICKVSIKVEERLRPKAETKCAARREHAARERAA